LEEANHNLVITEYFRKISHQFPQKVCLQIKRDSFWERWTYKELEDLVLKVAGFLILNGFKKGDFACLILENRPEWPALYLGIIFAGMSCVPLDPQLSIQEIKNLLQDCQAKIIFSSYDLFLDKIKPIIPELLIKSVVLDKELKEDSIYSFSEIKDISLEGISFPPLSCQDLASLIYTSGTTGKPKGVMLTHKNICANFLSIKQLNLCSSSDNFLSILPLHHAYAFMVTLIVPLFMGAKITYCKSIKSEEFVHLIKESSVTILVGVPQLFLLLHKAIFEKIKKIPFFLRPLFFPLIRLKIHQQFKSLRLCVSGGARLQPKVGKDLLKLGLKVIEGYGLTETSPVVSINPPDRIKFGSVGKAIPDVEIKIFNPDKEAIGEVLIRGPNVMKGYFKQPQLTDEVVKEGWFYSGDLGYMDKEGYLYLVGRKKEVIVLSSGKNIYPEELEAYYLKSPYIKEICIINKEEKIFGIKRDLLYAVIVPNLDYFSLKKEINIQQKIRWELENLSKALPTYQHIMGFILTKEKLPRSPLGKIRRYQVKEKYLSQKGVIFKESILSDEDKEILEKKISQKIIQYISQQITRPVNLDSHLEIDLGIDSLSRVELMLGLESYLKVKIPEEFIYKISTVKELILYLEKLINQKSSQPQMLKEKTWKEILDEPPNKKTTEKIKINFGFYEKMVSYLLRIMFLFLFRIFWFLRIKGSKNLPQEGTYIICPNHASYLDGIFVALGLPFNIYMNTYFVGHQQIFEHPLLFWLNKFLRFIPIDINTDFTEAMRAVSYVLKKGKIVCIFPEGMRSIDGKVKEFKKGVGILIKELNIPAVPVYIHNSHRSWPRLSKFPRFYPIKVSFGKPFYPKDSALDYETLVKELRERVLELSLNKK